MIDLHLLHTDPKFQRRGAASQLVNWGLQKADELNLPTYLESSPSAHHFYQKLGFKDLQAFSLDLSQYGGGSEPFVTPIMLKEPTKPSA